MLTACAHKDTHSVQSAHTHTHTQTHTFNNVKNFTVALVFLQKAIDEGYFTTRQECSWKDPTTTHSHWAENTVGWVLYA